MASDIKLNEDLVIQFGFLADQMATSTDAAARASAEAQLLAPFGDTTTSGSGSLLEVLGQPSLFNTMLQLLAHPASESHLYGRLLAARAIEECMRNSVNHMSSEALAELRMGYLHILAASARTMPPVIINVMVKTLSLVAVRRWNVDPAFQSIVQDASVLLGGSVGHKLVCFQLYEQLIVDICSVQRSSVEDRLLWLSFRDSVLPTIFGAGCAFLRAALKCMGIECNPLPTITPSVWALPTISETEALTFDEPRPQFDVNTFRLDEFRLDHIQHQDLLAAVLQAIVACFSYDFSGSNKDAEDETLPTYLSPSWRFICHPAYPALFRDVYNCCRSGILSEPAASPKCLAVQCLALLCSMHNASSSPADVTEICDALVMCSLPMIAAESNGADSDTLHQLARLALRLAANWPTPVFARVQGHRAWLEAFARLSCFCFSESYRVSSATVEYILSTWSVLVNNAGRSHVDVSAASSLSSILPNLVTAYLQSRMALATSAGEDAITDDYDSYSGDTLEQFQMATFAPVLLHNYWTSVHTFSSLLQAVVADASVQNAEQAAALHRKLAWVISGVACLLKPLVETSETKDVRWGHTEAERTDCINDAAGLLAYTFRVIMLLTSVAQDADMSSALEILERMGIATQGGASSSASSATPSAVLMNAWSPSRDRCELALMHFLRQCRLILLASLQAPNGDMPYLALTYFGAPVGQRSTLALVVDQVQAQLALPDIPSLINILLAKILSVLYAPSSAVSMRVYEAAMAAFLNFTGDTTVFRVGTNFLVLAPGKELLECACIKQLITDHASVMRMLPVLASPKQFRLRTQFMSTLARLMFVQARFGSGPELTKMSKPAAGNFSRLEDAGDRDGDDNRESADRQAADPEDVDVTAGEELFESFVSHLTERAAAIAAGVRGSGGRYTPPQLGDIAAWLRDARGVVQAAKLAKEYQMVYDWMFPHLFQLIKDLLVMFVREPMVTIPLLRLVSELCENSGGRITFSSTSADGFVLFRECSKIVQTTVDSLVTQDLFGPDIYTAVCKPATIVMQIAARLLKASVADFSIMKLYGDTSLEDMRTAVLKLFVHLPAEAYPKFGKLAFCSVDAVNQLVIYHATDMYLMAPEVVANVLTRLRLCLELPDVVATAAAAVDKLVMCRYKMLRAPEGSLQKTHAVAFDQFFAGEWQALLFTLFKIVFYGPRESMWPVAQPLFPLILCDMEQMADFVRRFVATLPRDSRATLFDEFGRLMAGINMSYTAQNSILFTKNLYAFVDAVKGRV